MAKMLGRIGWRRCTHDDCPYSWHQAFKQRQRARERVQLKRELFVDMRAVDPWDFGDDNALRSNEVWRADVENDAGLRLVEFDGTYTVGP